jgi:hypothetical protein
MDVFIDPSASSPIAVRVSCLASRKAFSGASSHLNAKAGIHFSQKMYSEA